MLFIRRGDNGVAEFDTDDLADVIAIALPASYEEGDEIVGEAPGTRAPIVFATLVVHEGGPTPTKLWQICAAAIAPACAKASSGARPISVR